MKTQDVELVPSLWRRSSIWWRGGKSPVRSWRSDGEPVKRRFSSKAETAGASHESTAAGLEPAAPVGSAVLLVLSSVLSQSRPAARGMEPL
ncbi:hypothetical protein EYF80_036097 [Liparis tanakae]|uniref:Uncharacterized protein n=1 Tax=Liparis tanakae TaxID=230148 RepID=A0A4Z2GKH8_9TELE|nr:hypothetical protein EYF80_036097 [Liparis tanakae]